MIAKDIISIEIEKIKSTLNRLAKKTENVKGAKFDVQCIETYVSSIEYLIKDLKEEKQMKRSSSWDDRPAPGTIGYTIEMGGGYHGCW